MMTQDSPTENYKKNYKSINDIQNITLVFQMLKSVLGILEYAEDGLWRYSVFMLLTQDLSCTS
jgi:hypothetical protein